MTIRRLAKTEAPPLVRAFIRGAFLAGSFIAKLCSLLLNAAAEQLPQLLRMISV